jgi:hypothetical protein
MSTRYLEINSTYRNRNQYPDPADFVVNISQSGTKDNLHANDPVSSAAPIRVWCPQTYESPIGTIVLNNTNSLSEFVVSYQVIDNVSKVVDYYVGTPYSFFSSIGSNTGTVIITGWDFLETDGVTDSFIVSINKPIYGIVVDDVLVTSSTTISLRFNSPTFLIYSTPSPPFPTPTLPDPPPLPFIFIPNGLDADNYYTDCIIYNQDKKEWRPIISYNGTNKLAGLDVSAQYGGPFITTNPPSLGEWSLTDTYVLRKKPPIQVGNITNFVNSLSVKLDITVSSLNPNEYIGNFIRFTSGLDINKIFRITDYGGNPPPPPPSPLPPYYIPPPPPPPPYEAILKCVFTPNDNNTVQETASGSSYEILPFTKDNEVPFMYNGSTVSQQEMVCYEIELVDLVLPNKVLSNGGRSIFYPFVYVELQNVSAPSAGLVNILYSNNPHSTRKLFRCPIDDMQHNLCSPFIKIDSGRTKQTIKFKPNDNLHFAVYLPNGKLFKTLIPENYSPNVPNPIIQISALFAIKRVQ